MICCSIEITVLTLCMFLHSRSAVLWVDWMCQNHVTFLANYTRDSCFFDCCLMKFCPEIWFAMNVASIRMSFSRFWLLAFLSCRELIPPRSRLATGPGQNLPSHRALVPSHSINKYLISFHESWFCEIFHPVSFQESLILFHFISWKCCLILSHFRS